MPLGPEQIIGQLAKVSRGYFNAQGDLVVNGAVMFTSDQLTKIGNQAARDAADMTPANRSSGIVIPTPKSR